MDIKNHYDALYKESIKKIVTDNYQIDNQIDSPSDHRFGLTVVIRPDNSTKNNIQRFLDELKGKDPDQYYYPNSAAHSTVARFRKPICNKDKLIEILEKYRDFDFGKFQVQRYYLVYNDWYQRAEFVKDLHEFQSR